MEALVGVVQILIQVLIFAIFAQAILSWFPVDRDGPVYRAIDFIAEPVLEPLRRVIPRIGMVDISPMVAILLLYVISSVLGQY